MEINQKIDILNTIVFRFMGRAWTTDFLAGQ